MAYRGYKYRLYPDSEARAYFARCFGATRYCYNYCVREFDKACAEGRRVSGFDIAAKAREHLNTVKWMADVDYEIKESAPRRFDNALGKFKRSEANRPREHKKGDRPYASYTTGGVIHVDFKHDLVQLPKIGIVRARLHRTFSGEIISATVKREADGNYYIILNVNSEDPDIPMKPHTTEGTIGIDVGLRHLATLSNGDHIEMPDMSRINDRITFLKKRQSLQQPGSRRYKRTAIKIAKMHHQIANISKDTHHKAAFTLCKEYDTICMETLNVAGMKRGQREEKTVGDIVFNAQLHRMGLASFIDRVKQKAENTGTNFVGIDRFEPTTKMCHVCGYVLPGIDLDTKEWTCPECGTRHDRDENAAINIRKKGIEQLQAKQPKVSNIRTLPLAGGNVKPAKKTTAGCDLRTGKRKARSGRPPKAQIADGSAPPRILFYQDLLTVVKLRPFARYINIPTKNITSWADYGVEKNDANFRNFLDKLQELANTCRAYKYKLLSIISEDQRLGTRRLKTCNALNEMNRLIDIATFSEQTFHHGKPFTWWRNLKRTNEEIIIINKWYTETVPEQIERFVSLYKYR